jgi:2',3'-cyclic-nucleotide 2'-phosphodiesterase (5'-nucleotidase family)
MTDYYNHIAVGASAIGNHEFDFGPAFLTAYLQKLENTIISANLIDNSTNATNEYPLYNQKVSKMFSFPINNPSPHIS